VKEAFEATHQAQASMPEIIAAARRSFALVLLAGVVGLVFAGAAALWMHYGTAVFFETIRAGFMACFG
jgi:hypothetical protein